MHLLLPTVLCLWLLLLRLLLRQQSSPLPWC
jgi:hypothetical protein